MTHEEMHMAVWRAIDALAAGNDLSVSALAKRAGLNISTFNKSKRFTRNGCPRWPSMETICKVLDATDTSWDAFGRLMEV